MFLLSPTAFPPMCFKLIIMKRVSPRTFNRSNNNPLRQPVPPRNLLVKPPPPQLPLLAKTSPSTCLKPQPRLVMAHAGRVPVVVPVAKHFRTSISFVTTLIFNNCASLFNSSLRCSSPFFSRSLLVTLKSRNSLAKTKNSSFSC